MNAPVGGADRFAQFHLHAHCARAREAVHRLVDGRVQGLLRTAARGDIGSMTSIEETIRRIVRDEITEAVAEITPSSGFPAEARFHAIVCDALSAVSR
jgi:hypothetical protein